jgi:hypothetical protein
MRKIRRLTNPKNIVKSPIIAREQLKARTPKRHIRIGNSRRNSYDSYLYYGREPDTQTWCGLKSFEGGDSIIDESDCLPSLRTKPFISRSKNCSCCDNAIIRALRQRILGI